MPADEARADEDRAAFAFAQAARVEHAAREDLDLEAGRELDASRSAACRPASPPRRGWRRRRIRSRRRRESGGRRAEASGGRSSAREPPDAFTSIAANAGRARSVRPRARATAWRRAAGRPPPASPRRAPPAPCRRAAGCAARAATARAMSIVIRPADSASLAGIHSGSPVHGATPCAHQQGLGHRHGIGRREADRARAARQASISSAQPTPRAASRAGGVEAASRARFEQREHPCRQVAHVDELQPRRSRHRRHEHLAAAGGTPRPVAEAPARIARADDQPRPHDDQALAEPAREHALALGLERAVGLAGDRRVGGKTVGARERCALVQPRRGERRIGRDAGDEQVARAAGQRAAPWVRTSAGRSRRCRSPRPSRRQRAPTRSPRRSPVSTSHAGGPVLACPAAVEHAHRVTARERRIEQRAAEEHAAAEDQQLHALYPEAPSLKRVRRRARSPARRRCTWCTARSARRCVRAD